MPDYDDILKDIDLAAMPQDLLATLACARGYNAGYTAALADANADLKQTQEPQDANTNA